MIHITLNHIQCNGFTRGSRCGIVPAAGKAAAAAANGVDP